MAGVMGHQYDLEQPFVSPHFVRARPGPVRRLNAWFHSPGTLMLRWKPPAGGGGVAGYRIERTREGRAYEWVGETKHPIFFVKELPVDEPWFYRVTAFNARGQGGSRLVWLFRWTSDDKLSLLPIAVIPGLRVTIWE